MPYQDMSVGSTSSRSSASHGYDDAPSNYSGATSSGSRSSRSSSRSSASSSHGYDDAPSNYSGATSSGSRSGRSSSRSSASSSHGYDDAPSNYSGATSSGSRSSRSSRSYRDDDDGNRSSRRSSLSDDDNRPSRSSRPNQNNNDNRSSARPSQDNRAEAVNASSSAGVGLSGLAAPSTAADQDEAQADAEAALHQSQERMRRDNAAAASAMRERTATGIDLDTIPPEMREYFGGSPRQSAGGYDQIRQNADGSYTSSDGSTYDPATGARSYDPLEDSFAVRETRVGLDMDGSLVETTTLSRDPDRVRSSEALALVETDPTGFAATYGNRAAFDRYNNPNMDSIRDHDLMHAAAKTGEQVAGRYPEEGLTYIGVPLTAHLARGAIRTTRPPDHELIGQLAPDVKFTGPDLLRITRSPTGQLTFLERGNRSAGLAHINRHADEFESKGISKEQIPDAVMTAVEKGTIVGYQGKGTQRPVIEYEFNSETHRMAVTVGSNGFVVGANPVSMPKGN